MLRDLLRGCLELITQATCPLCGRPAESAGGRGRDQPQPCQDCRQSLDLETQAGLCGLEPMPWWALGLYQGALRSLLLRQRREPSSQAIPCLGRSLAATLPAPLRELSVVAIPSWKRRANPLPKLICQGMGLPRLALLERSRATLGQHHLNRRLRALNQEGAFRVVPDGVSRSRRSRRGLLLVDDILTTGATAMAAAAALEDAGYPVLGLLCLARTPAPGRDLRSCGAAERPAGIAQLVEQATENRRVPSSNLGPGILS